MRLTTSILFIFLASFLGAQNIVISGGLFDCDTVDIYMLHDGAVVDHQREASSVYSIKLGVEDYYIIKFVRQDGEEKLLHFYCYNIDSPTVIPQNVHFSNKVNVILWIWRFRNKRGKDATHEIERTFYGEQASWKQEF